MQKEVSILRENYASKILVSFLPFCILSDLKIQKSWWGSYIEHAHQNHFDSCSKTTIKRMQVLHEKNIQQRSEDHCVLGDADVAEILETLDLEDALALGVEEKDKDVPEISRVKDKKPSVVVACLQKVKHRFNADVKFDIGGVDAVTPSDSVRFNNLEDVVVETKASKMDFSSFVETRIYKEKIVTTCNDSRPLDKTRFEPGKNPLDDIEEYPTIYDQGIRWTLNKQQYTAFRIYCYSFFLHLFKMHGFENLSKYQLPTFQKIRKLIPENGLRHFLVGSGGTGKSRVIHAFIDFLTRWGCQHMIRVTATSGIAAVYLSDQIAATTYHSVMKLNINKYFLPQVGTKEMDAWGMVAFWVIDEVGMMDASSLYRVH